MIRHMILHSLACISAALAEANMDSDPLEQDWPGVAEEEPLQILLNKTDEVLQTS